MGIPLLFMLSQYFDLMIQAVNYSKYSGSSIRDLCHLMLSILHQIHIVDTPDTHLRQLQTWFFSAKPSCIQSCIKTKPSRRTPVKSGRHWPARLWPLSSSHYPGYSMKKLTFYHKKRRPITSNWLLNLTTNRDVQRW